MKKALALLLSILLTFSITGCSGLTELIGVTVMPSDQDSDETSFTAGSTEETDSEAAPDPTAEPTPEPTPEPPIEEINAALELYHTLFVTGLTQVSDGFWQLNACEVLAADPVTYSPHGYNPLYWMEGFTLYDINDDYIPELILEQGEVENHIYIFAVRNGKIELVATSVSGNQEEINYALHVYMTPEGESKCYSIGIAGSSAGSLHFAYEIAQDFTVVESFQHFEDFESPTYSINGTDVNADQYETEYRTHFDSMILLERVPFTLFSNDPLAALEEAIHG